MDHTGKLLLDILIIFAGGKVFAEILERLRQPPLVGEILAGVVLGPSALSLIQANEFTLGLAEIGAIFLLFTVGLETPATALRQVGKIATLVACLGVALPFALGFFYMRLSAHSVVESTFVGAALVATSVGITARVLADGGFLNTPPARVILAAAVLDDILGMIALAVVSSLSMGKANYVSLGIVTAEAVAFSLFMILFGPRVVGHLRPTVSKLRTQNSAFFLAVILCLGLSLASVHIGMAAIIGAFLAGLALADHSGPWKLREHAHPIYEFLAPFFFVTLGARVNLRTVFGSDLLLAAGIVCLLAIVSKVVGCGLAALPLGRKDALRVGFGMVPRGEVGLIVAAVGLNLHTISPSTYAIVLLMSLVTTLFAPPALRLLFAQGSKTTS